MRLQEARICEQTLGPPAQVLSEWVALCGGRMLVGRVYFLDHGAACPPLSFLSPLDCFREFINFFSLYFFPELLSGNLFSIFFSSQFLVRRISLHMPHPGFFVRMVPLARGGHLEVRKAHALERPRVAGSVSGPK